MMEISSPKVSVVIPAYNQAKYLGESIQSVLSQTYTDFEIIVVDDGSTDETSHVVKEFTNRIRYIYQTNLGLGGARNTGIKNANGNYIALLDSDDLWLPTYLETMMRLAKHNPDVSVFYCGAQYMDADGNILPQFVEAKSYSSTNMYEALIKSNFIIPSTVLFRKSAVIEAGLFDQSFHRCEDWDLWLRLAPTTRFICSPDCMVHYRVHSSSLSADPRKMHQAAIAVAEKHFGSDDGDLMNWSKQKHLAYGGVYRYNAWTFVTRQNNWTGCLENLRRALQVDPTTSKDMDLFYDLAMGSQPLGMRGTAFKIDLHANILCVDRLLSQLFDSSAPSEVQLLRKQAYGTAYFTISLVAYQIDELSLCRKYLMKALFFRPDLWGDPRTVRNLIKSFLGRRLLNSLRKFRNHRIFSLSSN